MEINLDWILGGIIFATFVSSITLIFAVVWEHKHFADLRQRDALENVIQLQKIAEKEAAARAQTALKVAESRWQK